MVFLHCFWCTNLEDDTCHFAKAHSVCLKRKSSYRAPSSLLQPLPIPHHPWSHNSLDFVTGLPPSSGNTVILSVVDRFSKMTQFVPLFKLLLAKETAQLILHHVFHLYGITVLLSSFRPQFELAF